jgi:hypothetical protein
MEIKIEPIRQTLLENRVDDVKKKFPNVNSDIIDFFVRNDPSGNQKYLEWMVKAYSHLPTVHSINGDMLEYTQEKHGTAFTEAHIETANEIINLVNRFHELLPYLVSTDENGKKEGTTDLYLYKFTDSEMVHHLIFDLHQAFTRKEKKDKEKELRKGIDKIYEDKNWLVVRPKNWSSSCHYGAGTRWCTTSKETSNHFTRETVSKFLIYVINKNLDSSNDDYKVAWQIPYTKNIDILIDPLTYEVKMSGLRLWNAQDNDITSVGYDQLGEEYLNTVPISVKMSIATYMKREMAEMYKNLGYIDDPHMQALVEHLNLTQDEAEEIELLEYTNYGMKIFLLKDSGYAVADNDEIDEAKIQWAQDFMSMNGVNESIEFIGGNEYYYIKNQQQLAQELTDSYISDLSEDDILEMAREFREETVEEYGILLSTYELDIEEDIEELETSYQNEEIGDEEYGITKTKLTNEKKQLKLDIERTFEGLKGVVQEALNERYIDEMQNPVEWLKDWGWWEDGKPHPKAFEKDILGIDEDALVTDLADQQDIEYFSSTGDYWRQEIDNTFYYIIPTDV